MYARVHCHTLCALLHPTPVHPVPTGLTALVTLCLSVCALMSVPASALASYRANLRSLGTCAVPDVL